MADFKRTDGKTIPVGVASATVVDVGDWIYLDDAGQAKVVAGTGHVPIGIATTSSASGETDDVSVDMFDSNAEFNAVLAAAAAQTAGKLLKYSADKSLVAVTNSEDACQAIAITAKTASSATAIKAIGFGLGLMDRLVRCFTKTLATTGTTTTVTFATEGLDDAADTSYLVWIAPRFQVTIPPYPSAHAADGFTINHDNNVGASKTVDVLRIAIPKQD